MRTFSHLVVGKHFAWGERDESRVAYAVGHRSYVARGTEDTMPLPTLKLKISGRL